MVFHHFSPSGLIASRSRLPDVRWPSNVRSCRHGARSPALSQENTAILCLRMAVSVFDFRLFLNIGHKRKMTCSLDRYGKRSLMLCTVAGNSSRQDLAALGNVFPKLCYILVIDLIVLCSAEHSDFFSSAAAASLHWRIWSFASVIVSHVGSLLFIS